MFIQALNAQIEMAGHTLVDVPALNVPNIRDKR